LSGKGSVQEVADEVLRGSRLSLGRPISLPGVAVVPVIVPRILEWSIKSLRGTSEGGGAWVNVVKDIPQNTCGIILVDSQSKVIAFRIFHGVHDFWERIANMEDTVMRHYNESEQQIPEETAIGKAVVFLTRLSRMGPQGILSEGNSDYFAVVGSADEEEVASATEGSSYSWRAILYRAIEA
jgi:hypothetical protein